MNNRLKIISVHGAPPMYEGIFAKKLFIGGQTFWGKIFMGKVVLDGRTSDQIIPTWVMSFINDKYIFQ